MIATTTADPLRRQDELPPHPDRNKTTKEDNSPKASHTRGTPGPGLRNRGFSHPWARSIPLRTRGGGHAGAWRPPTQQPLSFLPSSHHQSWSPLTLSPYFGFDSDGLHHSSTGTGSHSAAPSFTGSTLPSIDVQRINKPLISAWLRPVVRALGGSARGAFGYTPSDHTLHQRCRPFLCAGSTTHPPAHSTLLVTMREPSEWPAGNAPASAQATNP